MPSMKAMRLACRLVDEIQEHGEVSAATRYSLVQQAQMSPERLADMLMSMAGLLADAEPPSLPRNEETFRKYLRRAHAAHTRGERYEWVMVGEREYQRLIQAERRERRRPDGKAGGGSAA